MVVLMLTALVRIRIGYDRPLWFDEVWTGVLAGPTSWLAFLHDCYLEASPPLYYLVARTSAAIAGESNAALRLPSVAFALAAPLVALLPVRLMERDTRLLWCGLVAAWAPGLWFTHDARPYAMLLFLAMLNTLAFAALLRKTGTRNAVLWIGSASLLILTHYFAGFLILAQGCLYLVYGRKQAVRTWPALLVLLPVLGWMAFHAPRMQQFANPEFAAYHPLRALDVQRCLGFIIGSQFIMWPVLGLMTALAIASLAAPGVRTRLRTEAEPGLWLTTIATIAGFSLVIVLATFRPILVPRYLTPFVPGMLLALALTVRRPGRLQGSSTFILIALFLFSLGLWVLAPERNESRYNFQYASDFLMKAKTTRLVFFWDHPTLPIEDRSQLQRVAGFFFTRAGKKVEVDPVFVPRGVDPNPMLLQHADAPGSAILWIYDGAVRGTAANTYPPALSRLNSDWRCEDFGRRRIKIIACTQHGPPKVA